MAVSLTDAIVVSAQAGEPQALSAVYRILAPQIIGYLRGKGVDDPEGVCQDVFLTVFTKLNSVHGGGAGLRTFAFSVAHARMVDYTRAQARSPRMDSYEPAEDLRQGESAESEALEAMGTGGLMELLDRLNPDHRETLLLRIVAGLSLDETATVMNRSVGSVKQLQRRGLAALKELVEEGQEG